jgi:membrane-associated protein
VPMILLMPLQTVRSLDELILWGGYLLLFAVIFSETGLFAGFFLPGDSLLITAGLIAASGDLDIRAVIATLIAGAVCGDSTGYLIGRQLQKNFFRKEDSRFFHRKHLQKTEAFYEKHGAKAVFLARFVPVLRSFAATLAGVTNMPYRIFLFYSVSGAIIWVLCFTFTGYFIASVFPDVVGYLHSIILVGIVLIILSALRHLRLVKNP